jgi:hypothetical protein
MQILLRASSSRKIRSERLMHLCALNSLRSLTITAHRDGCLRIDPFGVAALTPPTRLIPSLVSFDYADGRFEVEDDRSGDEHEDASQDDDEDDNDDDSGYEEEEEFGSEEEGDSDSATGEQAKESQPKQRTRRLHQYTPLRCPHAPIYSHTPSRIVASYDSSSAQ